jgi:small subunit ribosomal protein S17
MISALGVNQPTGSCGDRLCPYHGSLKIRGKLIEGMVEGIKSRKVITVRREYYFYVKKYLRYEKRRQMIHARLPSCVSVKMGSKVLLAETRPIGKNIAFVVLGERVS